MIVIVYHSQSATSAGFEIGCVHRRFLVIRERDRKERTREWNRRKDRDVSFLCLDVQR